MTPRLNASVLDGKQGGFSIAILETPNDVLAGRTEVPLDPPQGPGTILTLPVSTRSDVIVDTTRLAAANSLTPSTLGMYPSLIPVKGDPYYGAVRAPT